MPPAAHANSPGRFEGSEASGRGLGILSHRPLWALSLLCVQEGEVLFQDVTELPDQLVSLVREHVHEYPSEWKAIESIAEKLDMHHETLRIWVRRAEVDSGERPGLTTDERPRCGSSSVR